MIARFAVSVLLLSGLSWVALAHDEDLSLVERITSAISKDDVPITATFTGSDILVFGAIERSRFFRPGQDTLPEVIIAIRGPSGALIVRKKERVGGVWTNNAAVHVGSAPAYYAVASSKPIDEILNAFERTSARITLDSAVVFGGTPLSSVDPESFRQAIIRIRKSKGLYHEDTGTLSMIGASLFKASFALPPNIAEGEYTVRVLLARNGRVIDERDRVIAVHKDEFMQRVYAMSAERPLLYGALSVFIALVAGWGASAVFRRLKR